MKKIRTLFSFAVAMIVCGAFFVGCTTSSDTRPQPEPVEEGFLKYLPETIYWVDNDIEDPSKPWFELYDSRRLNVEVNDKKICLLVRYHSITGSVATTQATVIYDREMIDDNHFRLTEVDVWGGTSSDKAFYDAWLNIREQYISSTWIFSSEYKSGYGIYWRLSDEEGKVPDLIFEKDV